jgi:hypothetical protein
MKRLYAVRRCFRVAEIRQLRFIGLTGIVCLLGAVQAQAGNVTMASLLAGGSVACGDETFSGFTNFSSVASGGAGAPDATEVFVSAPSTCGTTDLFAGILFQSALWNVNSAQTMDTSFTFNVITPTGDLGDFLTGATLAFGSDGATGTGDIHVTESIYDTSNHNLANLLVDYQSAITSNSVTFLPPGYSELTIRKDISLEGNSAGTATLSTLTQNFTEATPEPGTVSMVGLGIIGVAVIARRRRSAK